MDTLIICSATAIILSSGVLDSYPEINRIQLIQWHCHRVWGWGSTFIAIAISSSLFLPLLLLIRLMLKVI